MKRLAARLYYPLLAGACDLATGVLLVAAPAAALRLMRVEDPVSELVWMRFIGAFVFGVGLLYVIAALAPGARGTRLRHAMELTAVVRACIALFVGASIATGALSAAWLSVFVTDAGMAGAQAAMLRAGVFDDAD